MPHPTPPFRRLRCFSFDPSLAGSLSTWDINEIEVDIPWEVDVDGTSIVTPGPVGEYIEVVDFDPASRLFYRPVDLNHPHVLARGGLSPSESDPQFHQQMVYAFAMATIANFERAAGRRVFWANRVQRKTATTEHVEFFVPRLRLYPHALRARNAYYSPEKKALLFGYFPAASADGTAAPGATVFACLSHDIIVHEMTHALLDGVHPRFNEPTNPDVYAFHEGFADLVAIFQRFSYKGILESQIRATGGDLKTQNLLAQLAQQFGRATGRGGALRDALGAVDDATGIWKALPPDPRALSRRPEPHDRGAVLVAAVFRAFTLSYDRKTADLLRIATGGTGVLAEGALHPDLVGRLAADARTLAARILRMCIRALDYCPPVDITFGDYLRAVITADLDINPADADGCRVAFVQSFREWGIVPAGVRAVAVDSLVWDDFATAGARLAQRQSGAATSDARTLSANKDRYRTAMQDGGKRLAAEIDKPALHIPIRTIDPWGDRKAVWTAMDRASFPIWTWLNDPANAMLARALNLVLDPKEAPATVHHNAKGRPKVEVHSIRPITCRGRRGGDTVFLVVEVTQRRRGYVDPADQARWDAGPPQALDDDDPGDFTVRAGATFFLDPATMDIGWVIPTAGTIADIARVNRLRAHLTGAGASRANAFAPGFRAGAEGGRDEPFAILHDVEG